MVDRSKAVALRPAFLIMATGVLGLILAGCTALSPARESAEQTPTTAPPSNPGPAPSTPAPAGTASPRLATATFALG